MKGASCKGYPSGVPSHPITLWRRALPRTALVVALACLVVPRAQEGVHARDGGDAPADGNAPAHAVGSAACAACHEDTHASWADTSHAKTFLPASPDTLPPEVLAGERIQHDAGTTQFLATDGGYVARTAGPDGKPTDYALTHVVGRMRIRMYVATLPDGRQQVLPSMLEVPTQTWFDYTKLLFGAPGLDWDTPPKVAPGDPSFWTGTSRSWDSNCVRCHVSGNEPAPGAPVATGPRTQHRALGVDCEMCHGPGSKHVAYREAEEAGKPIAGEDPLLKLSELTHERAVGVCLQCHMEADVVDRTFLPGDDVWEHVDPTLLLDPERIDPTGRCTELIYDGLPFSVSRCAGEGRLTCYTCHDPHGSAHASQLRAAPDDAALCASCHEDIAADPRAHSHHPEGSSGTSCVACHMPYLRIERGHGVVADHSISIPRPGLDLKADRLARDACSTCHQEGPLAGANAPAMGTEELRDAARAWWPDAKPLPAWARALAAGRLDAPDAQAALLRTLRDASLPPTVRASAAALLGKHAAQSLFALAAACKDDNSLVRRNALRALGTLDGPVVAALLRAGLDDPSRAVRRAAAQTAAKPWARLQQDPALLQATLPVLESDAHHVPEDWQRWYLLAGTLEVAGRPAEALRAYENMLLLDPFVAASIRKRVEALRSTHGEASTR